MDTIFNKFIMRRIYQWEERNKFEQLGLIESYIGKENIEMIRLTDLGRDVMNKLN